jgi:tetratricopeptide (TPR) repeat protein
MERSAELEQAAALCAGKRYAEAISRLRVLLAKDPHDLDCLGLLGEAQLSDHDPDGALVTATNAIAIDPERDLPHRQASVASSRRGLHRQAVAHAEEAVRLAPNEHRAFVVLARALLRAKTDLIRARRSAVQAIVLAPDEFEPHLVFGMVSAADREHAAAEAAFQRALALDPSSGAARNELSRLNLRRSAQASPATRVQAAAGGATVAGPQPPPPLRRRKRDVVARAVRARLSRRPASAENLTS